MGIATAAQRFRAVAAGLGAALLFGAPAAAGVIGPAETERAGIGLCFDLLQEDRKAYRVGNFLLLPGNGGIRELAPALDTATAGAETEAGEPETGSQTDPAENPDSTEGREAERTDLLPGIGDCLEQGGPVLQDLAGLEALDLGMVGTRDLTAPVSGWAATADWQPTAGSVSAQVGEGESLAAALSEYVTVMPGDAGVADGFPAAGEQPSPEEDLLGGGSLLPELLDRTLLREFMVGVLAPAIGTGDEETFSVLGVGQFRLEYDRGTSSLTLVETHTHATVSLASGPAGSGGRAAIGRGTDAGEGSGEPMTPRELLIYILERLVTSVWFYLCVLGGLAGLAFVKLRRSAAA
jgi:hypothetical protein